jgi:hypothetical protein
MNTFSDYSGYMNLLKYKSCKNKIIQNIDELKNNIDTLTNNIEDLTKTETLYTDIDTTCNRVSISTIYHTTFINPQPDVINTKSRMFILPANPSISNGFTKTIINNITLSQYNSVAIYCVNSENKGGLNILGQIYNAYYFAFQSDNLELLWNLSENTWTVIKYNSIFKNIILS